MNVNSLRDLYQHMQWADATVWVLVISSENAQKDSKLQEYFYHLHVAQYAFLRAWRGEAREDPYPKFDNSKDLMLWGKAYYSDLFTHLKNVSEEDLLKEMILPWSTMVEKRLGMVPKGTNLSETMLQVAMHSQYHRGQINSRLREVGGDPPLVDYIAWVWLGRPSPNWPAVE